MTERRILTALGLMSGTSLDGIDAAIIESDGETVKSTGAGISIPYDPDFRAALRGCLGKGQDETADMARELTLRHGDAVQQLWDQAGLKAADIDIIGFHGHTISHRPHEGVSVQIGDAALLAELTGIDVVADFRSADVAAGGEGAPFAPLYHQALAHDLETPLAVLNIGGVGNVSYIGGVLEAQLLAFDTGPGNALIDDWTAATIGRPMDEGGHLARGGSIDGVRLAAALDNPYFERPPPKSLDRDDFGGAFAEGLSPADGAATLTTLTIAAIAKSRDHFPAPPLRWLVTGGGRKNMTIMSVLAEILEVPVDPVEAMGWDGDLLEAQAFAYLAIRSLNGMALSLPTTTGVPEALSGGILHRA